MTVAAYRVTARVLGWNGENINVFHFSNATVVPADFGAVAVDMLTGFYNTLASVFAADTDVNVEQIINLGTNPVTYVPFDSTPFGITPGTGREDARVSATITWRTATATRRGRGRSFIGPLSQNAISTSTGLFSTTLQTDLQSAADNLISAGNTETAPLLVHSRAGNTIFPVTGRNVSLTPRTLRSRTLR